MTQTDQNTSAGAQHPGDREEWQGIGRHSEKTLP
jgi:hypothetical protein